MIIIIIKFIHYLAIVFSGGVLVGSGLIQSVYNKENKVPDITISKILKILGFIGLVSLIVLWISGIILSNLIYGGFVINSAFTLKLVAAAFSECSMFDVSSSSRVRKRNVNRKRH